MADYSQLYQTAGQQYGVDPYYLQAMAQQESGQNPNAVSPKGASGVLQLMPGTAEELGVKDPTDPTQNIPGGANYYSQQRIKYKDPNIALIAYNYGPANTDRWIQSGGNLEDLPAETKDYVQRVNANYRKLKPPTEAQVAQQTPVAYQANVGDPIAAALSAEPENSALTNAKVSSDPVAAALSEESLPSAPPASVAPANADTIPVGKKNDITDSLLTGVGRGLRTVAETVGDAGTALNNKLHLIPGLPDTTEDLAGAKDIQAQRQQQYGQQYGNSGFAKAGQIIGETLGTAPFLTAGGAAVGGAAGALGDAVPFVKPALNFLTGNMESNAITNSSGQLLKGATLGNQVARLASTVPVGAAAGAGANALTGGSPIQGAQTGAILGPAAKVVGDTLGSAYGKLVGQSSNLSPALQKILQRAQNDNLAPQDIAPALNALGPNATIGDLGPNLRGLQTSVLQVPGPGMGIVKDALESRNAGQADRLKNIAVTGLKTNPNATYMSTEAGLSAQQAAAATPIYKDAFASNQSIMTPEIAKILQTPAGKTAMKNAVTTMQNSRSLVGVSDPDLVEQAALTGQEPIGDGIASGLKLKTLDQVKQELWDLGEAAKGKFGEPTTQSRAIHNLRTSLTDELDNADTTAVKDAKGNIITPGKYAQARAAFADPAQSKDALEAGYQFMKNGAESNDALLKNLSPAQQPYFRVGAANWLQDTLHGSPDGANAVNKIFGSPAKRDAIKSIFPSAADFNAFEQQLNREKTFAETYGYSKNSLTYPYAASADDLAKQPTKMGNVLNAVKSLVPSNAAIGSAVLTHSPIPIAMDYGARGSRALYNKLTTPTPISGATSQELGQTMAKPFSPESSLSKLAPAPNPAQGRNDLIQWYMQHLGVPAGVLKSNQNSLQQ